MMCSVADDVACGNEVFCGKLKDCKYFKNLKLYYFRRLPVRHPRVS
jgi:hypothetical protein